MSHGPVDEKYVVQMNALAKFIDSTFNPDGERHVGFALLCFDFDCPVGARTNYISNAQRPDMLNAMKEFIARAEGKIRDGENLQ